MALITLVRHGQASFGAEDYDQLSKLGDEQARVLAAMVHAREEEIDCIVHGTLKRHVQSLNAFKSGISLRPTRIADACWNEFDHRDVLRQFVLAYPEFTDDVLSQQAERIFPAFAKAVARWQQRSNDSNYVESWQQFSDRVNQAWLNVSELAKKHQRVWVFTSGGPISLSVLQSLASGPEQLMQLNRRLANTGLTRFMYEQGQPQLLSLNEHGHLTGKYQNMLSYI